MFVRYLNGDDGRAGNRLPWWALAAGFAAAELCVFHVELRREAHTFSLAEVPLVLGLFFSSPLHLVAGRLAGEAAILGLRERQPPRKLCLNLSAFMAECVAGLLVVQAFGGARDIERPLSWLVALLAVFAADAISVMSVGLAIRWHGGAAEPHRLLLASSVTAVTNTSLALASALLLRTNPFSLVLLGAMVGVIVLAYRGFTSLSQRFASLQLLYDFTLLITGSNRPEAVLEAVLTKARELLRAESAGIRLFGAAASTAPASDATGPPPGRGPHATAASPTGPAPANADQPGSSAAAASSASPADDVWVGVDGTGTVRVTAPALPAELAAELGRTSGAVVVPRDTRDPALRRIADALGVPDCVVAPLVDRNGPVGLLLVTSRLSTVSTFDLQDGRLFATLANHASVALEKGRLIDRLHEEARQREHEALHDALTGLPNRSLFQQRLDGAIALSSASDDLLGVALMDLDHFKEVNDTLGHHSGDLLLEEVARRLRATLPPTVTVARFGGDEFALLVPALGHPRQLVDLGHAIQEAIGEPFPVEGLGLEIGASIGFSVFPHHGSDATTLLQRADVAMYTAKSSSTDHVELYDATRDTSSPRRLALASDLRHAIDSGQVMLYYQPKARLDDGRICGAEALVRWRHPELGPVSPEEFVPLAERTGLIQPFTDFVLSCAITQVAEWSRAGRRVEVSVNLSMRNLLDVGLPRRIADLMAEHAVDPALLTFEITESNIMSEPAKIIRVLGQLAALGVRLSVDDFGTGYSSLSYLQQLPVQEVKIDKSFVFPLTSDPGAVAIVRSIIDLSRNLGLSVVAEGVEDQRCWDRLRGLGCDRAQGYFLSRPIPPDEFGRWLDEREQAGSAVAGTGRTHG